MDDRIYDANGAPIMVGARTLAYEDAKHGIKIPAGVVTLLEPMDVDMDDETGRPVGYGPFVHVLYDDGTTDRHDCLIEDDDAYSRPTMFLCEDVEVDPTVPVVRETVPEGPRERACVYCGGRADSHYNAVPHCQQTSCLDALAKDDIPF